MRYIQFIISFELKFYIKKFITLALSNITDNKYLIANSH